MLWAVLARSTLLQKALRWVPWLLAALSLLLIADVAMAQSTGGSFGGGSFGGGGGGGGGGSDYSGGGGGEDGLLELVFYLIFSRLPWPLKIGGIVMIVGIWGGIKFFRHRRRRDQNQDNDE